MFDMIGYPKWIEDPVKLDKYYADVSSGFNPFHFRCDNFQRKAKFTVFSMQLDLSVHKANDKNDLACC